MTPDRPAPRPTAAARKVARKVSARTVDGTLRVVVVALVLPALGFGVLAAPGGTPAGAQAGPTFELVDRSPWVTVGGTLTLDLAIDQTIDAVRVRVHGRLEDATELAASRQADEGPVIFTGTFPVADLTPLSDGIGRLQLDVSDTVNEGTTVRLAFAGVYPVVIAPVDADGAVGDPIRTPVVRRSGAGTELDAPSLALAVDVSASPTAMASEDRRAFTGAELGRFRRLAGLLSRATPDVPMTALVSTDTLAGLTASDAPAADALLDALTTGGVTVVPQPTVPIDWTALVDAGLGDVIGDLVDAGRDAVTADLPAATVDTEMWDARGGIDVDDLEDVESAGYDRALVSSTLVRPDNAVGEVIEPVSPMHVDVDDAPDDLAVLAVDDTTTDGLSAAVGGPDAAHAALADLVLRAPGPATEVLSVVDDVSADSALMTAFDLLTAPDGPITLVSLDDPAPDADPEDPDEPGDAETDPPLVDLLPPSGRQVDDLSALAPRVLQAREATRTYSQTVGPDTPGASSARSLIAASLQRGLTRIERERLLTEVEELTATTLDGLAFTGPGDLNLTSRTGTLPIGVVNDADTPVTVVLAAQSDRLGFPDGETGPSGRNEVAITVELPPGESRIDLAVEALATGSVPLFVELRSVDGALFDARQLNVRSTAVSGVGLVLSAGALGVLLVWWVRTWRARRRDRAETSSSPEKSKVID